VQRLSHDLSSVKVKSAFWACGLRVKAFAYRRVKNDERDAADLADLLRMGRLPEAWLAPPQTRELRELVRGRHKLVNLRTSCRNQAHGVVAKQGIVVPMSDLFGAGGAVFLDELPLPAGYAARLRALREVMDSLDRQLALLDREISARLAEDVERAARCSARRRARVRRPRSTSSGSPWAAPYEIPLTESSAASMTSRASSAAVRGLPYPVRTPPLWARRPGRARRGRPGAAAARPGSSAASASRPWAGTPRRARRIG
jgi:hypothetical protein